MFEVPVPEMCIEEQMHDRGQTRAPLERSPAVQNLHCARNGDIYGIQKLFQTPGFLPRGVHHTPSSNNLCFA